MSKSIAVEIWKRKTVQFAISLMRLIQVMHVAGEVELRAPARRCPARGKHTEVIVIPTGLCGDCWSHQAIAAWRVPEARQA